MEFNRKSNYDKHLNKKKPCEVKDTDSNLIEENITITSPNIDSDNNKKQTIKQKQIKKDNIDYSYLRLPDNDILIELKKDDDKVKSESKKYILKMIDKGHNYLYNSENIEGEDALNDIMNFLFIKSIQPIISDKEEDGKIDLLNKKYYKDLYEDEQLIEILSYFTDLKLLAIQPLDAIRKMSESNDIIRQMGEILKTHPITGQIFTENNFIKAKKAPTIQGLLNEVIIPLNIKEIDQNEDVIGEIYEHIINGYVKKGSKLGQFFTPRKLMKLIFNYKEDRINEIIQKIDKKDKIKFYDSCMGTGGWLVTGYNLFKEKYADRLLLSGGEVKSTTFQYGLMNLILTLKKFPHDVKCESSLTHINNNKHHFVLTNPPFQTDKKFDKIKENFNSDDYTKKNKIKLDDIYELKDNNPPIQFLELDKYKLEDNGLCLIILPYGELFFGSSNKSIREYFMKETKITDIILFEGGTFTHTGIKTCALIFENNKKGTESINFIEANKDCNILIKKTTVTIDDIKKEPNCSWYLRDYLKDEYIENLSSKLTNFEWIEFREIFTLEKGKLQSSKVEEDEDGITFVTGAKDQNFKKIKKNELSYINGENIFISSNGNGNKRPIKYFIGECNYSDLMSLMILSDKYKTKINKKYVYYFLKSLQEHIEESYQKGACNKSLDIKNFNRMKIPILPLEEQNKIIEFNDIMLNQIKLLNMMKNDTEILLLSLLELFIKTETENNNIIIKNMNDICDIKIGGTPSRNNSEYWEDGNNLWVSISELNNNIINDTNEKITDLGVQKSNVKLVKKGSILLSFKLSIGKLALAGCDLYTNEAIASINSIIKEIPNKYLYYCLKILDIKRYGRGIMSVHGSLNMEQLKLIKIPILVNNNYSNIINDIICFENTINNYLSNIELINNQLNNQFIKYLQSIKNNRL
jgi:type I restriction-modification system DNA methylase subunit